MINRFCGLVSVSDVWSPWKFELVAALVGEVALGQVPLSRSIMSNATCTLISCSSDGSLGGFGTVLVWLSHILLGFSALAYSIAFGLIWDGASNLAQLHALDPFLKEKGIQSPAKAYEALSACEDQVVKHLAFWLTSLQRTWGAFQTAVGIGLWCIIFMMPVKHRAPVHFLVGYLQIVVGLIAASLIWGRPLPDWVIKFGGTKAGGSRAAHVASEENAVKGFPRPSSGIVKADFWQHQILGFINVTLGVLCLFSD